MKKYFVFLFISLCLFGCTGIYRYTQAVKTIDATEVSRTILNFSEKLYYDKHLQLEDSVVYYNTSINRIRLDFSSMDTLDIWEARAVLVDLVEELLDRINGNAIINSDLSSVPFTASDLEVYIYFKSFYNHYIMLQSVGMISLKQGIASYIASDGFDCETPCWRKRNEYYYQSRDFITFKRQGEALYKPKTTASDKDYSVEVGTSTYRNANAKPYAQPQSYQPNIGRIRFINR